MSKFILNINNANKGIQNVLIYNKIFIKKDVSLEVTTILNYYTNRWLIEVLFK